MYRSNPSKNLKSVLKHQPQSCAKLEENLAQTSVRSTKRILNLFTKPISDCNGKEPKKNVLITKKEHNVIEEDTVKADTSSAIDNSKIIFNVVMGKKSNRKHKKWEDDGTLEVTGKDAILKNAEGNIVRRIKVNPEMLIEGFRIYADNKEIEIVDRVTSQSILDEAEEKIVEPPPKKLKISSSKPYFPVGPLHKELKLKCNPLVMPFVNRSEDWEKNDVSENETEVSVDACLVNVLRSHQRYGIVFLYECIMGLKVPNYYGAILADEMGLGKTLQCITVMWTLLKKGPYGRPVLKTVLIVTPSSLCNNWSKELKHWLGFHRIFPFVVHSKNKPKDFKKQIRNSVMIISYDMLIRCQEEMKQINFDLIICDEGHRLKNSDIKAAKILNSLNCRKRILLTGTPIQNDLQEFYALIDFVNPGILGSNSEFKRYYENPIVASQCPNAPHYVVSIGTERANELNEKTKPFVLRRTQETINKYLPSKHELIVFCRLSDEQENLYSRVTDLWFSSSTLASNNMPHLTVVTALKKICNHPELFYNDKNELWGDGLRKPNNNCSPRNSRERPYCGKISIVQTLMKNLKKTDEKLVLISYYTQTLDLLENVCKAESLAFVRLDGSTTNNTRSKIIEQFNSKSDNSKVFLLSAKAGGVGLNLPGASRLVLFDSDWNPASDSQAMARIWRDGQKKDVYIIRLLTRGTIEEKIFQRQISKASLSKIVVDSSNFASLKLSMNELKDLFTLTTNTNCLTHDLMKCPCNGYKEAEEIAEKLHEANDREYQFVLEDNTPKTNLSINQLLKWEHYQRPVPNKIVQEMMLLDVLDNITFILKNSILNKKN